MRTRTRRVPLALAVALFVVWLSGPAYAQELKLTPNEGPPGTIVHPSGCGWNQDPAVSLDIYFGVDGNGNGGIPVAQNIPVDPSNNCIQGTAAFEVPNKPPGTYRVMACQGCRQSGEVRAPLVQFTIPPETPPPVTTTTLPPGVTPVADFSVSCNPSALSANPGGSAPSTCTVTSQGGFNKPVTLSCEKQPVGSACAFKPNPVTPPPNGKINSALTVNVLPNAGTGTFPFQVVGTSGALKRQQKMNLTISLLTPSPTPSEEPTPVEETPVELEPELELDSPSVEPGGEIVANGSGCDPHSQVFISIQEPASETASGSEAGATEPVVEEPSTGGGAGSTGTVTATASAEPATGLDRSTSTQALEPAPVSPTVTAEPQTEPSASAESDEATPAAITTADEEGDFRASVTVPPRIEVGRHEVVADCGPTIRTPLDVVLVVQTQSPAAPMVVLAVLIFFVLEVRRLVRREGAVTPRR